MASIPVQSKAPKGRKYFQSGQTDVIQVKAIDVGEIFKIRIGVRVSKSIKVTKLA